MKIHALTVHAIPIALMLGLAAIAQAQSLDIKPGLGRRP